MDAVVAMLSRNWPDPTTQEEREEASRHVSAFVRNFPHLAAALEFNERPVNYRGSTAYAALIPKSGPLAELMTAFSARVGLALFRERFRKAAPADSLVFSSWHPNAQLDGDEAIEEILRAMGPVKTIRQGRWEVSEQFRYWSAVPVDAPDHFGCFAAFRQSFGILAVIRPAAGDQPNTDYALRPGFLKSLRN